MVNCLCILVEMKTFIVHVRERRVRAVTTTKCVAVAESGEMAIRLVKGFYGPACHGWNPDAEFVLDSEIPPNGVKMV